MTIRIPSDLSETETMQLMKEQLKQEQTDLLARLRVKIAQLEAEPCFPGSHFHGRLEGLKEALEIIEY